MPLVLRLAALFVFCVWAVEICLRAGIGARVKRMSDAARRAARVTHRRASDSWKQKAMLILSGRMMLASLTLGGILLIAFLPFIVWSLCADPFGVIRFSLTLIGLVSATAFATLYVKWRLRHAR